MFRKAFLICIFLASTALFAKPEGHQFASGSGSVATSGDATTVTLKDNAIINWDSFSIGKSELVNFLQAGANSAVLNRVLGGSSSELLGSLLSNGKVYLLNPNGVLIGEGARIDTAGFTASTLDVLDEDFLKGQDLLFKGESDNSVINLGSITCPAGNILLIARSVKNEGTLDAKEGTVGLASGNNVLIKFEGKEHIFIRSTVEDYTEEDGAQNSGVIEALTAELKSASPYEKAVNTTGVINAYGFNEENGRIFLVANEGRNTFDGKITAEGGEVHILGKEVHLSENALIDVSADDGAGTVLIGGDYRGENPEILNADLTFAAPGAIVKADGGQRGDGGKVIFWGNKRTEFFADVSARGGDLGGDGGFVEVSAPQLVFRGTADRLAPYGKPGTLLLDPTDFNICKSPCTTTGSFTGGAYIPVAPNPNNILDTDLSSQLNSGDVLLWVGIPPEQPGGVGEVTFKTTTTVSWSANTSLNIIARNIKMESSAKIESTGTGTSPAPAMEFLTKPSEGPAPASFVGIEILAAKVISNTGDISMEATGGTGDFNDGIRLQEDLSGGGAEIKTISGNITLDGISGLSSAGKIASGIYINSVSATINSQITSVDGNISLVGKGNPSSSSNEFNNGIYAFSGSKIFTTGNGNISLDGEGGNGNDTSMGVRMGSATALSSSISTTNGDISITGQGGLRSFSNIGIGIFKGGSVSSSNGTIELVGTGGGSIAKGFSNNFCSGISIFDNSAGPNVQITGGNGDIVLLGTGGGIPTYSDGNSGIIIKDGEVKHDGSGKIVMIGTATTGSTGNHGIEIDATSPLTSIIGSTIILNGTGASGSGGADNYGFFQHNQANISGSTVSLGGTGASTGGDRSYGLYIKDAQALGTNSIIIGGDGGGASSIAGSAANCYGVFLEDNTNNPNVYVPSGNGSITIDGTGGGFGASSNNTGVFLNTGAVENAGTGAINMTGTATTGSDNNRGIEIFPSDSSAPPILGSNIILTGTGASVSGGDNNQGIYQRSGVDLEGDDIFYTGVGAPSGGTSCHGIYLNDSELLAHDTLRLTGTAGGTSSGNVGVFLDNNALVQTDEATSEFIKIVGTGGTVGPDSWGVQIDNSSQVNAQGGGFLDIIGNSMGGTHNGILIDNEATVASEDVAPIKMRAQSDLIIQNGAKIDAQGTGPVTINVKRDLSILSSDAHSSGIILSYGDATITVGRNLTIRSVESSLATIGATSLGLGSTNPTANITFPFIGGDVLLEATHTLGWAQIGHNPGALASGETVSGNINFAKILGNVTLNGATTIDVENSGFALIGHFDHSNGSTLLGDISLLTQKSITLNSGIAVLAVAQIGHLKSVTGITTFGPSTMSVIAGQNISLIAGFDVGLGIPVPAVIKNSYSGGPLTLVVDNLHPHPIGFGPGSFSLSQDSIVSTAGGGQLRIYTVQPSQNVINEDINGVPFVPNPFGEDDPFETYFTYYPSGGYGGQAFNLYYKIAPSTHTHSVINHAFIVANSQLSNLVPIFRFMRLPQYPVHHGEFCSLPVREKTLEEMRRRCRFDPNFDPYGSFIFEDNVYWVGRDR